MNTRDYFDEPATGADPDATIADGQSVPLDPRAPFERGEVLGRYVVLETLGAGGMGIVLAAYDSTLDRRVALKLLHRGASSDPDNHTRLLREAQALAKLSHPGVVSVYDVGELRGQVFIAMEFIDGPNLRRWLRDNPRDNHRILSFFLRAGRALQAAHDAGIVHRDFKPDNVLIGPDGRAHVTDFGLALEANVDPLSADPGTSSSTTHDRLTQTGVVMGTPAYMPIEQHAGKPTDHRSDQFSFCVALFEALYGIRPFSGANARELCLAIRRAQFPPAPAGVSVPRRVHRAILRGLAPKPDDRHPNMRALLRAIKPPARTRNTWLVGSVGGLALGAGLVAIVNTDADSQPCSAFADRMRAVYDDEHQQQILAAFTATGLPYAQAAFDTTSAALDSYAQQWVSGATEACLATERGEQSEHMLDLRMHCLDRGPSRVGAAVELLADADMDLVRKADSLVADLPELEMCRDLDALERNAVLPASEAEAAQSEVLFAVLDRVESLSVAGRYADAKTTYAEYETRFEASAYPPVLARALRLRGRLSGADNDADAAIATFERVYVIALEHGLDAVGASVASSLAFYHSEFRFAYDEADFYLDVALALGRASGSSRVLAGVYGNLVTLRLRQSRFDEAVEAAQKQVEFAESVVPLGVLDLATALNSLAEARMKRDGPEAGLVPFERARALILGDFGRDHPKLIPVYRGFATIHRAMGDSKEALAQAQRALDVARAVYGPGSLDEAYELANYAGIVRADGRQQEALKIYLDIDQTFQRELGTTHPVRASLLNNLASLYVDLDELNEARDKFVGALEIAELHADGPDATALILRRNTASIELLLGNTDRAEQHAKNALEQALAIYGPEHPETAMSHSVLGQVELQQGKFVAAQSSLERARQIGQELASDQARGDYYLGRALYEDPDATNSQQQRALALVRGAEKALGSERNVADAHAEVRAWLDEHDEDFTSG